MKFSVPVKRERGLAGPHRKGRDHGRGAQRPRGRGSTAGWLSHGPQRARTPAVSTSLLQHPKTGPSRAQPLLSPRQAVLTSGSGPQPPPPPNAGLISTSSMKGSGPPVGPHKGLSLGRTPLQWSPPCPRTPQRPQPVSVGSALSLQLPAQSSRNSDRPGRRAETGGGWRRPVSTKRQAPPRQCPRPHPGAQVIQGRSPPTPKNWAGLGRGQH